MNVTVFGGSQPAPGAPIYQNAYRLGQLLGQAGHNVLTGGYIGVMEAVSRGAAESGAHVIGVTCAEIERWRPVKANAWVKEERRCATLSERLEKLIDGCDAAVAMPGGPGTLTEIALMWNRMLVESAPKRPLVLVGAGWQTVLSNFFEIQDIYVKPHDRQLLTFVPDVESVLPAILDR